MVVKGFITLALGGSGWQWQTLYLNTTIQAEDVSNTDTNECFKYLLLFIQISFFQKRRF